MDRLDKLLPSGLGGMQDFWAETWPGALLTCCVPTVLTPYSLLRPVSVPVEAARKNNTAKKAWTSPCHVREKRR